MFENISDLVSKLLHISFVATLVDMKRSPHMSRLELKVDSEVVSEILLKL
jgi:hypothetical protein